MVVWLILQCDGQYIPLPSLQGIAVLNIPSYAGGTNFWGGTKEDDVSDDARGHEGFFSSNSISHPDSELKYDTM